MKRESIIRESDTMSVMSTITLLQQSEREISDWIDQLRKEILIHPDPLVAFKQLKMAERTLVEALSDKRITRRIFLEAYSRGESSFRHKGTLYSVNDVTDEVNIVL